MINQDTIANTLEAFSKSISKEQIELYKKVIGDIKFDVNSPENFHIGVVKPFEFFVEGLVASEIKSSYDLMFIYSHYRFIEQQFLYFIKKYEGFVCCVDKTRTIIDGLVKYFKEDTEIKWDYEQEPSFEMPKKVFREHQDIINFYIAIKDLYHGDPINYMVVVKKIIDSINKIP